MKTLRTVVAGLTCLLLSSAVALTEPSRSRTWPGFRGHDLSGVAVARKLPVKWSATEGVAWSREIPGRGWSSPIVWDNTVYVTSAVGAKPFKQPSPGIYGNDYAAELQKQGLSMDEIMKRLQARDNENTNEAGELRYMLYALDAKSGKVKWEREVFRAAPFGGRHRKNTFASETPVTDGQRLYVSFGQNVGLFCYDLKGKLLWKKQWPPKRIYLDFGTASSPVVHDGRLYLLHDNEEESYLLALDAATGNELWRTARTSSGMLKSGWTTPYIWKNSVRTEIVTVGHAAIISYNLEGQELWRARTMLSSSSISPLAANGLLYVGIGAQGDANRPLFAIKPGASGDITLAKDATSNEFIPWFHPRAAGYTSSPLVYGGRIYLVHDLGVLVVLDAASGKELYKTRAGGVGNTFSASPVGAGDRVYLLNEEGATIVLDARADEYKELARNELGEMSLASPAVAADALFIRTQTRLYRIGR
jgi:outer membrane protein assembly factor BamB